MKRIQDYIEEIANVQEGTVTDAKAADFIDDVKNSINELATIIGSEANIDPKKIKFEVTKNGKGQVSFESNDLKDYFGYFGPLMFKEINLITWDGGLYEEDGKRYIHFNMKWGFEYHSGGSNGTTALFNGVRYYVDNKKWEVGQRLYK